MKSARGQRKKVKKSDRGASKKEADAKETNKKQWGGPRKNTDTRQKNRMKSARGQRKSKEIR